MIVREDETGGEVGEPRSHEGGSRTRPLRSSLLSNRPPWVIVLAVWAASRSFFFVVGAIGHAFVGQAQVIGDFPAPLGVFSYWAHWDGRWFAHIAANGYDTDTATAFFPLYPLTIRAGAETGLGVALAGVLVSSLAALAALYFVYELGRSWYGERAALVSILTLAFFPTAFYLNAVYSDPLFLALSAGSLWALYVRRDLMLAGLFACFAAATRNIGVLLLLPMAYEWARGPRTTTGWRAALGFTAPLAGLGSYLLYLWLEKGEPLLFLRAYQEKWGRGFGNPLEKMSSALRHSGDGFVFLWPDRMFSTSSAAPPYVLSNTLNLWFLLFACCALILAVRRIPRGALLYTVPAAFGPLFRDSTDLPLNSYSRYVLVVFPLFLALGAILAQSWKATLTWLLASASLGAYLTLLFVTWRWVA